MKELTKEEVSLLLYLESRATDYDGRIDQRMMNDNDREVLSKWTENNFVESDRICFEHCNQQGTTWVKLTEEAMDTAHKFRKERIERCWKNRNYKTTKEKREEK